MNKQAETVSTQRKRLVSPLTNVEDSLQNQPNCKKQYSTDITHEGNLGRKLGTMYYYANCYLPFVLLHTCICIYMFTLLKTSVLILGWGRWALSRNVLFCYHTFLLPQWKRIFAPVALRTPAYATNRRSQAQRSVSPQTSRFKADSCQLKWRRRR